MSSYPSRTASPATQGGGVGPGSGTRGSAAKSAGTTLFRRSLWEGGVPLEIRIDQKELPADSDLYYLQVRFYLLSLSEFNVMMLI
jgi:hypothetical protein